MSTADTIRSGPPRRPPWLVAGALAVLPPLLVVAAQLGWGTSVPNPLPTHWDLSGEVNGTTPVMAFFIGCLVTAAALAGLSVASLERLRVGHGARFFSAAMVWGAWLVALMYVDILWSARGATEAAAVGQAWWQVVGMPLAPLLPAAAAYLLLPPGHTAHHHPRSRSSGRTVGLGATERAVWVGKTRSLPMLGGGIVAVVVALVIMVLDSGVSAIAAFVVGVALLATGEITVRVDMRGLRVMLGPVGWPRLRVRLDQVEDVDAEPIRPLEWGGWGVRMSSRGTGVVVRSGPGLVVQRLGKRPLAVTVDDPEYGAQLLRALLERERLAR